MTPWTVAYQAPLKCFWLKFDSKGTKKAIPNFQEVRYNDSKDRTISPRGEEKSWLIRSRGKAKELIQRNNQMNKKVLVISFCLRRRDYYLLIDQTTGWFQIG